MPDWRRNVLSTSEAFIDALQKDRLEDEPPLALDPIAASYPRRSGRLRPPATCPYTTIFLGTAREHAVRPPAALRSAFCGDSSDIYADDFSVDRSSNLTDTSSFANYEDRRDESDSEAEARARERVALQIQKVPLTSSVFYVSARSDRTSEDTLPANEVYLVDAESDALSSCTCDSFERCEFDCKDYEPFSDTCCCDPYADGGCSRSPGDVESPEGFCERWPEDDAVSTKSDMEGLDLALFEPAKDSLSRAGAGLAESAPRTAPPEPPAPPRDSDVLCGVLHSPQPPPAANAKS